MEKPQIRWPKMRKLVFLITYTILLFLILFRIEAVSKAVLWFLNVISPLLIGLALAFIFHLPMNFFQTKVFCSWERHKCRMLKKLYKPLTLILAYLSVFLFIAGFSALVLPRIADSVMRLAANFTVYVARFREWLDGVMGSASITPELSALISEVWQQVLLFLQQMLATIVSRAFDFTIGLTTGLLRLLLSLMISGYMLYNKDKLLAQVKRLCAACIGKAKTERACEVLKISTHVFSRFIVGTLTAALALGIMCFIGMRLLNMQYAFFISSIIAVTQLVPIIGPILGTIPCALILFVIEPMQALWFVLFIAILQRIDNAFVSPHILGNAIGLPGLWVLTSIIIGGAMFGVWGMLLGAPFAAVAYRLVGEWVKKRERTRPLVYRAEEDE